MAFEISPVEMLDFDIPAGKDKKVTITVPPMDCMDAKDVENINTQLREIGESYEGEPANNPTKNGAALVRFMLKYYNPTKAKADAIDALVPRQLNEIDKHWSAESGIELGKSSASIDESSETDE